MESQYKTFFEQKDLSHSLREARIGDFGVISSRCEELARNECSSQYEDMAKKLAFVVAYSYSGSGGGGDPFSVLNNAIVYFESGLFYSVRHLFYGLLQGLRILPRMKFQRLYRALNTVIRWKKGEKVVFPAFTSTSTVHDVVLRFLGETPSNKRIGTIMTIIGCFGYDISAYSFFDEAEIIIEPFQSFLVEDITKEDQVADVTLKDDGKSVPILIERLPFSRIVSDYESQLFQSAAGHYVKRKELKKAFFRLSDGPEKAECLEAIRKEEEAAANDYLEAAKVGNKVGFFNLGNCYAAGVGVKRDIKEAINQWARLRFLDKDEIWFLHVMNNVRFIAPGGIDLSGLFNNHYPFLKHDYLFFVKHRFCCK